MSGLDPTRVFLSLWIVLLLALALKRCGSRLNFSDAEVNVTAFLELGDTGCCHGKAGNYRISKRLQCKYGVKDAHTNLEVHFRTGIDSRTSLVSAIIQIAMINR